MNEQLKSQIKSLYGAGFKSAEAIIGELTRPSTSTETYEVARPAYEYEVELYHILIPNVVTIQELMPLNKKERLDLVQSKLLTAFGAAPAEQKAQVLAISMRVSILNQRIEENGSTGFSDPNFLQQNSTESRSITGQSWLETNGLTAPSNQEILEAITT